MKKKVSETKRGKICALDQEGDYWFYGWDLKYEDLDWPFTDIPDKENVDIKNQYARWGIGPHGEFGSVLWIADGPKQGAFKVSCVMEKF